MRTAIGAIAVPLLLAAGAHLAMAGEAVFDYPREPKVLSEEEKQRRRDHLTRYTRLERGAAEAELIAVMTKKYGEFRLPAQLNLDPELDRYLRYTADHMKLRKWCPSYLPPARYVAHALRDLWLEYGDEAAGARCVLILKHVLSAVETVNDRALAERIDGRGTQNPWHFILKEAAYQYALLYDTTKDERYARRVCLLLARFGGVVGTWDIHYKKTKRGKTTYGTVEVGEEPLPLGLNYGLWGYWGHVHDLVAALPLVNAYGLVADSHTFADFDPDRRTLIVDRLLHGLIRAHRLFPFRPPLNQNMNRINGLIRFGLTVRHPRYIHQACQWTRDLLHMGYWRDGFWCEGALIYGRDITRGILKAVPPLEGYTDPPGYRDPHTGRRFDNFSVDREFGEAFTRVSRPYRLLGLPNGRFIALDDTTWNAPRKFFDPVPSRAAPVLLGASGVGMLGFGEGPEQVRLFLHWNGTHGHDHFDCLGMALWTCGQELASETGYRGVRAWNISTAAHNTVVVDERNQQNTGNGNQQPGTKDQAVPLYPAYTFDHVGHGVGTDNAGRLVLWDTTAPDLQAVEVDGTRSYNRVAGVELYRRTLVLVRLSKERFYIVDIFRVEGGKVHDWMLHGNLERAYQVRLTEPGGEALPLVAREGQLGEFLNNLRGAAAPWDGNLSAEFSARDGAVLRTIVAGKLGTQVMLADGPAIRRAPEPSSRDDYVLKEGHRVKAPFLCVRRPGPVNIFVAVHEAYRDGPVVQNVSLLDVRSASPSAVAVRVSLKDRSDVVFSNLDPTVPADVLVAGTTAELSGRLLHATLQDAEPVNVTLFETGMFKWGGRQWAGPAAYTGKVVGIESRDRGNARNAFHVEGDLPPGDELAGATLLVYDGESRPHPFTIAAVSRSAHGRCWVETQGETGLVLADDGLTMSFFPCWHVPGPVTYRIPRRGRVTQ